MADTSAVPLICDKCKMEIDPKAVSYYTMYPTEDVPFRRLCGICREELLRKQQQKENNGWICPKCGKVYSPSVKECEKCNQR